LRKYQGYGFATNGSIPRTVSEIRGVSLAIIVSDQEVMDMSINNVRTVVENISPLKSMAVIDVLLIGW
jgi:hypothetical protein